MFKNFSVICSLLVSALLFTAGCSTKSNDSSNGGNITNGGSAASIANADSFFLLSGATAVQPSVASSAVVSENNINRDDDNDDDDDDDGSILYYSDDNGTSKELFFNVNGIRNRGYIDDLIYAGENWLLAEIDGFRTVSENGTLTGRFREDERYVLINITNGNMKDLPANQMRACGGDIELFEVVGGNGYAICEDAAYKIDLATLTASSIGAVGHDQYDDSAVVVFADGTVLAVNGASATSNTSAYINRTSPIITFDTAINYSFIEVSEIFAGIFAANGENKTYVSRAELEADLNNPSFMGAYYYDQLKFLFGDMWYEQDDGQYELKLLNSYTRVKSPEEKYNFINFKDKDSKIYTLSLEDNFTVTLLPTKDVALAEISVDSSGKLVRNIVSQQGVILGSTGFSGILVNRKDSTTRHLDTQHAFDHQSYYTINMVEKTVKATPWKVSSEDLSAMKTTVRRPGSGSVRNSVYYGEEGIAFILNNMVRHVKYEAGAVAKDVVKPVSCTNPTNVSVDGRIVYYNCGRDTYMVDTDVPTSTPKLFSSQGKVIGNIIEVQNKRR